jgi:hypothetical protein
MDPAGIAGEAPSARHEHSELCVRWPAFPRAEAEGDRHRSEERGGQQRQDDCEHDG